VQALADAPEMEFTNARDKELRDLRRETRKVLEAKGYKDPFPTNEG
jgi:hypothetical protein